MMKRSVWRGSLVALLAGLFLLVYIEGGWIGLSKVRAASEAAPMPAARNQPAPAIDLSGLDGKAYHVGGARSKALIINFWASWCGPCHDEAPDLERMYSKYKNELDIYAVNVTKGDQLEEVSKFVKRYGLSFPVLLDQQGSVANKYRLLFVPTSFLVNKQGILVDVIHVLPAEELERRIQQLVKG
ncbi:TlpA family protein disulfide reductase [Paenibacillus agricola]|uniref:TlpA family protein disulfide reductase n=1 Tax=Paenibacillus agricola TaxID=2716264 RepID=A0ABX0JBB6_9BACL|nr:TlpA disulfide reductase family protein [Paenibacillus agricola]NHN31241.1 TlpA family protein disulfide reductase [Paenibacillus agricola]